MTSTPSRIYHSSISFWLSLILHISLSLSLSLSTSLSLSLSQAIMSLLKHSVILLAQENLSVLSDRCRDPALSVKKKAMQCLGELLHVRP